MNFAIGYIHPGMIHEAFASSLRRYCTANPDTLVISGRSGSLLARARNDVTRAALNQSVDVLLWVDTDMIFGNDDVNDLVNAVDDELPILGGFYLAVNPDGTVFSSCVPRLREDEVDGSIREVQGQGMGFCAVKMDRLEEVLDAYPYPYGEWYDQELGYTDQDVGFCFRARDAGVPNFVHTGIRIAHIKERVI